MTDSLNNWYAGQPVVIHQNTTNDLSTWYAGQPFVWYKYSSTGTTAIGIKINASGELEETSVLTKVLKMGSSGLEEVNASSGGVKILSLGAGGLIEVTS